MTDVGKRIRAAREAAGLTQEELARKVGYTSKSTINKIELGINDLRQPKVKAFAAALGVTPAYLMGWEDEPPQSQNTDREDDKMWYLDRETAELAQELKDNPELRILFDAARNVPAEDLRVVQATVEALLRKDRHET